MLVFVLYFRKFFCSKNVMAIHNFHKIIDTARSNVKVTSSGYLVLSSDFSGEPAACPGGTFACVLSESSSEFEVGRATSCDKLPSTVQSSPMDLASSLWQNWKMHLVTFGRMVYVCCFNQCRGSCLGFLWRWWHHNRTWAPEPAQTPTRNCDTTLSTSCRWYPSS